MPTSEVYLCDKQEDLLNDPGRPCRKAVGDDGIELVLTLSASDLGLVFERKFCGRTHANYWLTRQRLAARSEFQTRDAGA